MSMLLLAALLQAATGDITIAEAEALARRDEATLHGEISSRFFADQGKAVGRSLVACGVNSPREVAGIMVVIRLNERGQVTRTWLNKQTSLGQCFETRLQSEVMQTDGRSEFYSFVNFNF
jgi:hypothetical protein